MRKGKTNGGQRSKRKAGDSKSLITYFKQKRLRTQNSSECLDLEGAKQQEIRESGNGDEGEQGKGFFACYLLTSLNPRQKGHTYIGFTVNPRRRIRQHNGEIGSGAWRTKSRRPWEMVICIYGFPTNVSALQFEWAWQHPRESVAVRQAAATFKSLSGVANKIKLAYTMLTLPAWQSLNITVNYFSTKYTKHSACCPSLPEQMKVQVCSMDELPCYTEQDEMEYKDDCDNLDEYDEVIDTCETAWEMHPDEVGNFSADNLHSIIDCDNLDEYDEVNDTCETAWEMHPDEVGNVSADNSHSIIDEASHELSEHIEGYGTTKPVDSSTLGVPNMELQVSIDSPTTKAASIATGLSRVEAAECADMSIAARGSLKGKQFTYDVEADEHPKPRQRQKPSNNYEEYEKLGVSSTFGGYDTHPIDVLCSPVRTSSSIVTCHSNDETVEGANVSIIEKECSSQKQITASMTAKANGDQENPLATEVTVGEDQLPNTTIAHEVVVIDLLTPSPECRVRSYSKKRRISVISPEIIDLT